PEVWQDRDHSSTLPGALHVAVALAIVAICGSSIATAGPPPPSDVQIITRHLEAAAQSNPLSCAADTVNMSPVAMVGGAGGVGAAARLPRLGPSSQLWVQCALPYSKGKPGGDCEGKHDMTWQVYNAGPDLKVKAELIALDKDGKFLRGFQVKQGENV